VCQAGKSEKVCNFCLIKGYIKLPTQTVMEIGSAYLYSAVESSRSHLSPLALKDFLGITSFILSINIIT
jgi:hypothetical protein